MLQVIFWQALNCDIFFIFSIFCPLPVYSLYKFSYNIWQKFHAFLISLGKTFQHSYLFQENYYILEIIPPDSGITPLPNGIMIFWSKGTELNWIAYFFLKFLDSNNLRKKIACSIQALWENVSKSILSFLEKFHIICFDWLRFVISNADFTKFILYNCLV